MQHKIEQAFGDIHADQGLKYRTFQAVTGKKKPSLMRGLAPILVCLAVLVLGGFRLYEIPTAHISIDCNPSIELAVNRFNRVIAVTGWNDDGEALAATVQLVHRDYREAVETVVETPIMQKLLAHNELLCIGVIGDTAQTERMLADIRQESGGQTYCYQGNSELLEAAHSCGLSCGKYQTYLEIQAENPEITVEDVQSMTMREMHDMLGHHGHKSEVPVTPAETVGETTEVPTVTEASTHHGGKHSGHHG